MLRLKTDIWVKAYIRRCYGENVPAVVVHKGDPDAGAIYIKVNGLLGPVWVYGPAPQGYDESGFERRWCLAFGGDEASEAEADNYLSRQRDFDRDIWVIEVEDRDGRHFLDDALVTGD